MVYKQFLSALSFLTIIPVGRTAKNISLENISKNMFLFPIIGFIIGVLAVLVGIVVFSFFDHHISAFLVTIFLIILTGSHHTDALGDFADGIMAKGNREKKHQVMHDPRIGSAGAVAVSSYLIGMTLAISSIYSNMVPKIEHAIPEEDSLDSNKKQRNRVKQLQLHRQDTESNERVKEKQKPRKDNLITRKKQFQTENNTYPSNAKTNIAPYQIFADQEILEDEIQKFANILESSINLEYILDKILK